MTKGTKIFAAVFAVVAVLTVAWIGYRAYDLYYAPQTTAAGVVRFPSEGSRQHLIDTLYHRELVRDTAKLRDALERLDFSYRSGQFEIEEGWSAKDLVDHLRAGRQKEARVVLTNGRLLGDVAAKATRFVEADSAELHAALSDTNWLAERGLTPATAIATAIPNTYNVYWNASPAELRDRLAAESERFWDRNDRRARADSLGLTPLEVYTLASIVDAETNVTAEMPTIAGVYLNRLRIGMPLQADPTVVFAVGDFTLRRVLYKHLEHDSPYNTYMYPGLPPGPIMMAGIDAIDAVLQPEEHDYLYFVTRGDGSGTHAFARDQRGHGRNIREFKETLRARGIRR